MCVCVSVWVFVCVKKKKIPQLPIKNQLCSGSKNLSLIKLSPHNRFSQQSAINNTTLH